MRRLLILSLILLSFAANAYAANKVRYQFNPFTGKPDAVLDTETQVVDFEGDSLDAECHYWGDDESTSLCYDANSGTIVMTVEGTFAQQWAAEVGGFLLLDDDTSYLLLDDGVSKLEFGST